MSGKRRGQRFDAQHGVTTEALLFLGELDPHAIGAALEDATHYQAVPIGEFATLLDALPEPLERFTFVDVGAGMGRAVLLASRRPFARILGLEVSPALAAIARENVQRWLNDASNVRVRDIRVAIGDAASWEPPTAHLVVFLYNPFGARTLRSLLDRLSMVAQSRDVYVVYHTPVHAGELDARAQPVADFSFGIVRRLEAARS